MNKDGDYDWRPMRVRAVSVATVRGAAQSSVHIGRVGSKASVVSLQMGQNKKVD